MLVVHEDGAILFLVFCQMFKSANPIELLWLLQFMRYSHNQNNGGKQGKLLCNYIVAKLSWPHKNYSTQSNTLN